MSVRSGYGAVLRRRDVLSVLAPYAMTRLPLSMVLLALLLLARRATGSFADAGVVCAAFGTAAAIAGPRWGRAVDRGGQRRVLVACSLAHPVAMVCLVAAAAARQPVLLAATAIAAGAAQPPLSACMRALWPRLLGEEHAARGYAVEAFLVESSELAGPALVTAAAVLADPAAAVLLCAGLTGVGGLLFARSPVSRTVEGEPVTGRRHGALASPGVRALLVVIVLSTTVVGALEVAVTGFAARPGHGGLALAGGYLAAVSAGGLAVSSLAGRRRPGIGFLVGTLLASAVAAVVAGAGGVAVALVALAVFGMAHSAAFVAQLGLMAAVAPERVRTEAFTWGSAANFVGLALGNVAAGALVDAHGTAAGFALAGASAVVAALAALGMARVLVPRVVDAVGPTAAEEALLAQVAGLERRLAGVEEELAVARGQRLLESTERRCTAMLARADAECLALREAAQADADRVRSAATVAALEVLGSAERDARALLARPPASPPSTPAPASGGGAPAPASGGGAPAPASGGGAPAPASGGGAAFADLSLR